MQNQSTTGTLIDEHHLAHWLQHGYVLVPGFLSREELDEARDQIDRLLANGGKPENGVISVEFPFDGGWLSRAIGHTELVSFVERAIGTRDVVLTQSHFWAKFAGAGDYDQPLHVDYANNTLTYPREEGRFRQVSFSLYYSDVTEDLGPTYVVSQERTRDRFLYPNSWPRENFPELYTHEVPIVGPAGSLLIYGMRTFHRGSAFRASLGHRYNQFMVYRAAENLWMGLGRDYAGLGDTGPMRCFLENATPRQRELIGFPGVGHPYWNDETIAGVGARYPGMDMQPYYEAAFGEPARLISS